MFSVAYREDVRNQLLAKAKHDERIVSAAIIGSYAKGTVDRWSDIDLTFGVGEGYSVMAVLEDWTKRVREDYGGVDLLDVWRGNTIYRVFVLPGNLQLDISFSPEKEFGALNKDFVLLYGKQYDKPQQKETNVKDLYGWIIHHLIRTKYCIARNRLWQAEYWLSEARDYMLNILCIEQGLNADHGRGYDDLPKEITNKLKGAFIREINKAEIERVLQLQLEILSDFSESAVLMPKRFYRILNDLQN